MALSTQLSVSNILQMLTQNPGVAVFALQTTDFPNGVTRVALLSALNAQLASTNPGSFDTTTGKWNSQIYAPGILVNAGEQIPASPAANMAVVANPLPLITVNGASAAGSALGIVNTPGQVV